MRASLLALLLILGAPAAAEDLVTLDAASRERAGVRTATVATAPFGARVRAVGQIVRAPGSTTTVKSILPGRVEELRATPGERVRAGQVLLSLHSHEMLGMQGELLRAAERGRMAATRLAAGRELLALEAISRLELQSREQEAMSAELDLGEARAELHDLGFGDADLERLLAERRVDPHLQVISPVDGVVLELAVEEHEWVEAYAPLMVVGDPRRVELDLQIAPDAVTAVAAGDLVEFTLAGRPGAPGTAVVLSQVPQVDPTTRTVRLRARLDESSARYLPGVFVEGEIRHGVDRETAAAPESAVIRLGDRDVVFVRRDADTFEARPVGLGRLDDGLWELTDGVQVGEEIAVGGVFLLKSALLAGPGEEG